MRSIVTVATVLIARMAAADALPPDVRKAVEDRHLSHTFAADAKLHGLLFDRPECARFQPPQTLAAKDRDAFDACIAGAMPMVEGDELVLMLKADARYYGLRFAVKTKGGKIIQLAGTGADAGELDLPTLTEGPYRDFIPSDTTRKELGDRHAAATVRVCADEKGNVTSRRVVKKSGVAHYDTELAAHLETMKARDPVMIANTAVKVCRRLEVTFPVAARPVKEIVQPVTIEKAPPPPPPPPPPAGNPPKVVPPTAIEPLRIAGTKLIVPDDKTKVAIEASGKAKITASFKLCLDATGAVDVVKLLRSSGFTAYDQLLEHEIHGWKYKPYVEGGRAISVCTAVTFIYSQH